MDYKGLLDVSNFTIGAITRSIYRMGLSGELITTQIMEEYAAEDILKLLHESGLSIDGDTPEGISNSFTELMNKLGAVGEVKIPKSSDTEIDITLKDCVFNTATSLTRSSNPKEVPVCPWIAILSASLLNVTNKAPAISNYEWDEKTNTCKFQVKVE